MTCIMLNPPQSIVLTQLLTDLLTFSENVLQGLEVSGSELGTLLLQMLPACALGGWRRGLLPSCSPHWGFTAVYPQRSPSSSPSRSGANIPNSMWAILVCFLSLIILWGKFSFFGGCLPKLVCKKKLTYKYWEAILKGMKDFWENSRLVFGSLDVSSIWLSRDMEKLIDDTVLTEDLWAPPPGSLPEPQ